jgi:hypothetical protein
LCQEEKFTRYGAVLKSSWGYRDKELSERNPDDPEKIANQYRANITVNEVNAKEFFTDGKPVLEETGNKSLEGVTQTVVTLSVPTEHAFKECLLKLIDKYRAPRTVYSTWGSDERAKEIFQEVVDQWDGWF